MLGTKLTSLSETASRQHDDGAPADFQDKCSMPDVVTPAHRVLPAD
jgi:hypothetical protein